MRLCLCLLQILQFTPESDPELCEGVLEAVRFLLDEERERGSRGEWRTKREQGNCGKWLAANEKVYDRYHASFCAAAALMDYPFVEVIAIMLSRVCQCFSHI
jgi:hypothetical protein